MANNLYGFDKLTNARFLIGEIENGFSFAENIDGTPSNMKLIIVSDEKEEYEVNTICYHDHTNTWWVINADTSTYLTSGEYKHELELVDGFEWFNFRTLVDCAFKQDRYTLETMLERIFALTKITCSLEFADFLDEDKPMKYMAFTNYTLASAITQIAKSVLAIPKLKWTNGETLSGMTLYFLSRIGDDTKAIITNIDIAFPVAYEQNASSKGQYKTRSVSNISNAQAIPSLTPLIGGFQISCSSSYKLEDDNMVLVMPNKIDHIEYIAYTTRLYFEYILYESGTPTTTQGLYDGFYFDAEAIRAKIKTYVSSNGVNMDTDDIDAMEMLEIDWVRVNYQAKLLGDTGYVDDGTPMSGAKTLLTKREYEELLANGTLTLQQKKDLTFYWERNTNEIKVPKNFGTYGVSNSVKSLLEIESGTTKEVIQVSVYGGTLDPNNTYFRVCFSPIADIKISYDNNYESQDERYYNQSGQSIDALTASKLIYTDVMESADGTKIRQAKHSTWASCVSIGQLVKIENDVWIINQRSIDYSPSLYGAVGGYYSAIYNLSKDRVARSEFINADSSIISFAPPDKNLIERNELYKDYIELSLEYANNETAYFADFFTFLNIGETYCGFDVNFMFIGISELEVLDDREYLLMPTAFELTKSKLFVVRFPDNNYIGQRLDKVGTDYIQTTINYTEADGGAKNIYGYLLSEQDAYDTNYDMIGLTLNPELLPFNNYPELPEDYLSVLVANNNWSIKFGEESGSYDKDPFEVPVFSYQIQINDSSCSIGQLMVADDILTRFAPSTGETMRFYYVISSTTRFTNDSADKLWASSNSLPYAKFIEIAKANNIFTLSLFALTNSPNTTALQGKHIGIYACIINEAGGFGEAKFLFGINFYQGVSNSTIPIYINNWKI